MSKETIDLKEIIAYENKYWSEIFRQEKKRLNKKNSAYSSFWWKLYYKKIKEIMLNYLAEFKNPQILEAGSGSGKASIILGKKLNRVFLDISSQALKYAKFLAKFFKAKQIKFVQGNIFKMPFDKNKFDLVWNIGVLEHYNLNQIEQIFDEMLRVTKGNGFVVIGLPNFWSGPILKAKLLSLPLFNKFPGYKLDTEKFYSLREIRETFKKSVKKNKRKIVMHKTYFIGNPLPMETPKFILQTLGRIIEYFFPRSKFLQLYIWKVK